MDHLHPDDIILTGVRQRKKNSEPISCPVCGVTVRPAEMEQHYAVEVDRLHKVYTAGKSSKRSSTSYQQSPKHHQNQVVAGCSAAAATGTAATSTAAAAAASAAEPIDAKECWNTYQRIKNNRQARLKVRI